MNQVYSPDGMPELELSYDTRTGEVDICDAKINGQSISDPLYQLIIERNRAIFETAILFHIKKMKISNEGPTYRRVQGDNKTL